MSCGRRPLRQRRPSRGSNAHGSADGDRAQRKAARVAWSAGAGSAPADQRHPQGFTFVAGAMTVLSDGFASRAVRVVATAWNVTFPNAASCSENV
jgi:hypothetical protein